MKNKAQKSLIQTNIKKHIAYSYDYELVCVDFKTYVGKDAVYNFVNRRK